MSSLLVFVPLLLIVGVLILLIVKFTPNKNRSIGVILFSIWFIIQGISALQYRSVIGGFAFVITAFFICISIGLIKLYNPARIIGMITYAFISCLLGLNVLLSAINHKEQNIVSKYLATFCASLLIFIGIVFFFTRPKVKEQFIKKS